MSILFPRAASSFDEMLIDFAGIILENQIKKTRLLQSLVITCSLQRILDRAWQNTFFTSSSEIVENTGYSFDDIATYGAVVAVEINWDCNFDLSAKKCNPKFNFRRYRSAGIVCL